MASIRMPAWLRIGLVAGVLLLVAGAGLFGYVWYSRPTTLTIAAGSLDGEATKLVSALASRLAATKERVRLNLVETTSAFEAADLFSSDKVDLAADQYAQGIEIVNLIPPDQAQAWADKWLDLRAKAFPRRE